MSRFRIVTIARLAALCLLLPPTARAQVDLWVTNTAAFGPGSFSAALAALDPDTAVRQRIRFAFSTTQPVGISNVISYNGPVPDLDGIDVSIDGSDITAGVILDGGGHPILTLPASASTTHLRVANLTLRRGGRIGRGGCMAVAKANVAASLVNVDFEDCNAYLDATTPARGGALYSASGIAISDSTFLRNEVLSLAGAEATADASGGAVSIETGGAVVVERSLFESNRVYLTNTLPSFCRSGSGGALSLAMTSGATVDVRGSSFIDNLTSCRNPTVTYDIAGTGDGGAVVVYGTATHRFENNFLSGNIGNRGGGVGVDHAGSSEMTFVNNTFTGNRANASGGGIGMVNCCILTLHHNTFIDNLGHPSFGSQLSLLGSRLASLRYNAVSGGTPTCTAPLNVTNPVQVDHNAYSDAGCVIAAQTGAQTDLGPLPYAAPAMLGGDTLSMAPAYGSTMIDAGPPDAPCASLYDVRGTVRPIDGNQDGTPACDIGAVESSFVPMAQAIFADGFEAAGGN